jgi:Cu-processing system permease protein
MKSLVVAADLLRQALRRKWFLGLGLVMTAGLTLLALSLRMDVVDGALAGARLFGAVVSTGIVAADVAVRPVFEAVTYVIFYGATAFLVLACSDFAPRLLAPGRIEHMLALPVRRYELITGTYLGVVTLGGLAVLYGAGGLVALLGVKTGVWTLRPLLAALLGILAFASLYSVMLAIALVARSAALSAATGGGLLVLGIVAGFRAKMLPAWQPGIGRSVFAGLTLLVPRISTLGQTCADIAASRPIALGPLAGLCGTFFLFAGGGLALAVWLCERKDF